MIKTSFIGFVFFCIALFTSCSSSEISGEGNSETTEELPQRALQEILNRGKLIAYTENSVTSYFIYRGQPMGFDYDMFSKFAEQLGVELEIKLVTDFDAVIDSLKEERGDLAGGNYTITQDRKKRVDFSTPLTKTRQILVQRLPENAYQLTLQQIRDSLITDPIELAGKTIYVRKSSSFYDRLINLEKEIGQDINIVEAPLDWETEDLIRKVSEGEINYTVADKNVGLVNQLFYTNIDVNTPISFTQEIAWFADKQSNALIDTLNAWLNEYKKTAEYAVIYAKYFKYRTQHKMRIDNDYTLLDGGEISPYDDLIKKHASDINWDWRLVAALIFKESKFNSNIESWAGAKGLMQVMPTTAEHYGYDPTGLYNPAKNIAIGTKHLKWVSDYWYEQIGDSVEARKFALASYNAGIGHVKDAQRLADKYDLESTVWSENVETMLLNKSEPEFYRSDVVKHGYCRGREPVQYVQTIMNRYNDYKNFVD